MHDQDLHVSTIFVVPLMRFLVIIALFIALLNGQRDLTIWTLLILAMASGAKVWSTLSVSHIHASLTVNKTRLFPGETFRLDVLAENRKFLPVWFQLRVPVAGMFPSAEDASDFRKESGLLWFQTVRFQWEFHAQHRGVYTIETPGIQTGDLFGFFPRTVDLKDSSHELIVYPRLIPLKAPELPKREFFGIPGQKSPIQDPIYILGTRDYQPGRPARSIHWKASVRHNRLQEKLCEPAEQEKVLLLLDVNQFVRQQTGEDFERMLEVVASFAVHLDRQGYAVGLIANARLSGGKIPMIPVDRNAHQVSAILEMLARILPESRGKMEEILRHSLSLPGGVSCVHFSYDHDDETRRTAQILRQRNRPLVSVVCQSGDHQKKRQGKVYTLEELSLHQQTHQS